MGSNFLKSITTLLLIFSTLSIATAFILDTDGEPLFNSRKYYILPQSLGFGGGLIRTTKTTDLPCPYYITVDNDDTSYGMPLIISSPFRILYTPLSSPVYIAFEEMITVCIESMGWRLNPDNSTGRSYMSTGASGFDLTQRFTIEHAGSEFENNVYKIRYIGASGEGRDVGFFDFNEDGLLGITDDIPLTVMFKKAIILEETTSGM